MKRSAFVDLVATHQADPALRDELRALAPDTTDDGDSRPMVMTRRPAWIHQKYERPYNG